MVDEPKVYEAISSDGTRIVISRELFQTLLRAQSEKINGGIKLELRNGGVAGVVLKWRVK